MIMLNSAQSITTNCHIFIYLINNFFKNALAYVNALLFAVKYFVCPTLFHPQAACVGKWWVGPLEAMLLDFSHFVIFNLFELNML